LLERLVARQVIDHLQSKNSLSVQQSAYWQFKLGSTNLTNSSSNYSTTILQVLSDILQAVDEGDVAVLALLDLSAAFDTVDYGIVMQRLQSSYGFHGSALLWF